MISVLSREQMRAFDAYSIETCKVPSLVLMENAGRGATDVLVRELLGGRAEGARVVVACGHGNNGGDGFVVARHLLVRGARVEAWLAGDMSRMTADCRANHDAFVGLGGKVSSIGRDGHGVGDFGKALATADVAVDALFGTGLDRPLSEPFTRVVAALDAASCKIVALDVPSGMNADTGVAMGAAVSADLTVTFAHPKLGHLTGHGARLSGDVHVVDIGVPSSLVRERAASIVEAKDVRARLTPRPVDAHKYSAGHVAVLGGSPGRVGASMLAAQAALRGGAGAVTIVTWPEAASSLESRVVEIMTARIGEGDAASIDEATWNAALTDQVDGALLNKRAVVVGPGFGTDPRARAAVRHVLLGFTGPIVVDADALSMHARSIQDFAAAAGRAILTPHAGELARLLGTTSEEVEADRFSAARVAAARAQCVVVLKGPHTLVARPDGRIAVNSTGNAALATAGAGDVLAGLCGALACVLPPFEAAYCAVWLHGAAADAWRADHADRGLLAGEVANLVPRVLAKLMAD